MALKPDQHEPSVEETRCGILGFSVGPQLVETRMEKLRKERAEGIRAEAAVGGVGITGNVPRVKLMPMGYFRVAGLLGYVRVVGLWLW